MKKSVWKFLFFINYILLLFYMRCVLRQEPPAVNIYIPLLISTLMLIDITFIDSCNIRENSVVSLFCGLLALESWYLLLASREGRTERFLFAALSPVTCTLSIRFALMFLFQDSGYRFRRTVNVLLSVTCIGSLAGLALSGRIFAGLYGIQFLVGWSCFFILLICHRKRILFVLKSEWKCISCSLLVITIPFFFYWLAAKNIRNPASNFGIYLPMLLFFLSVHSIVFREHSSSPLSAVFSRKQSALILCCALLVIVLLTLTSKGGPEHLFVPVNALFAFIYLCNIILGQNFAQGKGNIIVESSYLAELRRLQHEELLKAEFADFLHDEVLQDLLSVKNMMTKSHRPDVQDLILETLDELNGHIREQMQDYHPVILKNLTAKENYQNLIEAVSQSFPQRTITVFFDCPDDLFLVEPWHIVVYRLLRELLTNVFKHSDGSRVRISLSQENNRIGLCVRDNGSAPCGCLTAADKTRHKGIASMAEQVQRINGSMVISDDVPQGVCVRITLPMKGDVSYQYFVS